jgi:hypothetical protein
MQKGGFSQPPSLIGGCSTRAESTLAGTPVMGPGPDLTTVPIIALDLSAQEGLFEDWNTAIFDAGACQIREPL